MTGERSRSTRTHLFGRAGRLHMAWYVLRGYTVAYRLTIRDGGIDLRDGPAKQMVQEVQIYGADVAWHLPDADLKSA